MQNLFASIFVAHSRDRYTMNEEANLRVLFDNLMKNAELRANRELWDEYLRFEVAYGNLTSIERCAC